MAQYKKMGFSLIKPAILTLVLTSATTVCRAYGTNLQKTEGQSMSNQELLAAFESSNKEQSHQAIIDIVKRGEVMIPLLLQRKGNKNFFHGYGLGHRNSSFLLPLPTGNRKADEGRVITLEVGALYLVSAIFYESLEFAQAPYLTDGSPVKMQRFNTPERVSKAWRAVETWHARVKSEGIDSLRRRKNSPLRDSGLHFWATSE